MDHMVPERKNTLVVPHQTRMKSTYVERTCKAEGSKWGTDIEVWTFTDLTRLSVKAFMDDGNLPES